jgi:hypothetical protein
MAAAFCACRFVRVDAPAIPAAAYLASISVPGRGFGGTIGVSGGGGDPRVAFVVEVEAVELSLWTVAGSRMFNLPGCPPESAEDAPGGGQYC